MNCIKVTDQRRNAVDLVGHFVSASSPLHTGRTNPQNDYFAGRDWRRQQSPLPLQRHPQREQRLDIGVNGNKVRNGGPMAGRARSSEGTLDTESNELTLQERFDEVIPKSHTIKDIAELAGVSIATVSRVVNGSARVSDEKRTRILALISDSHYCPNAHAVELVRGRHGNLRGSALHRISEVEGDVRRHSVPGSAGKHEGVQKINSLRKENVELRNLVGILSREIEKWRRRGGRKIEAEIATK